MAERQVYIAGIGITELESANSNASISDLAISAGTKALLDAGLTYGAVDYSIACFLEDELKVTKSSFGKFGKTGAPVIEVDCYSGLFSAWHGVRSGHANCSMMIGFDREVAAQRKQASSFKGRVAAVAVILVSHNFLTSHAYLKDSAAEIRGSQLASPVHSRSSQRTSETLATKRAIQGALEQAVLAPDDIQIVELRYGSNQSAQLALGELKVAEDGHASPISHPFIGSTGLAGVCELVWQLRGWTRNRSVSGARNCLQYTMGPDGTAYATVISRADRKASPSWDEVEHLRDGRERLAHNPALEAKKISIEDWHAVRAEDEFVPEETGTRLRLSAKGGDRAALARL